MTNLWNEKIYCIELLLNFLNDDSLQTELDSINDDFIMDLLANNCNTPNDTVKVIISNSHLEKLDLLFSSILLKLEDTEEITNINKQYIGVKIVYNIEEESTSNCECGESMIIDKELAELKCMVCGCVTNICGTVFDNTQIYTPDNKKPNPGRFKPNKHLHEWLHNILGIKSMEIAAKHNITEEQVFEKLRVSISSDPALKIRQLTIKEIRKQLKNNHLTFLNKYSTYILKKISGIKPPDLPADVYQELLNYCILVLEVYEKIKYQNDLKNINKYYYPYYIYKTADAIWPENSPYRKMLNFIYLQKEDSIKEKDEKWKLICGQIERFYYQPTDIYKIW
jgi:hypothetical protein